MCKCKSKYHFSVARYPGYGIEVNDAILAATVIHTGGAIFCLNVKHYPMPEINVKKAWA